MQLECASITVPTSNVLKQNLTWGWFAGRRPISKITFSPPTHSSIYENMDKERSTAFPNPSQFFFNHLNFHFWLLPRPENTHRRGREGSLYRWSPVSLVWILPTPTEKICCYLYVGKWLNPDKCQTGGQLNGDTSLYHDLVPSATLVSVLWPGSHCQKLN